MFIRWIGPNIGRVQIQCNQNSLFASYSVRKNSVIGARQSLVPNCFDIVAARSQRGCGIDQEVHRAFPCEFGRVGKSDVPIWRRQCRIAGGISARSRPAAILSRITETMILVPADARFAVANGRVDAHPFSAVLHMLIYASLSITTRPYFAMSPTALSLLTARRDSSRLRNIFIPPAL